MTTIRQIRGTKVTDLYRSNSNLIERLQGGSEVGMALEDVGESSSSVRRRRNEEIDPRIASGSSDNDLKGAPQTSSSLAQLLLVFLSESGDTVTSIMGWWSLDGIRLVLPLSPGPLRLRSAEPRAEPKVKENGDGRVKDTVSQWVQGNVPSLQGRYKPTWWLPK